MNHIQLVKQEIAKPQKYGTTEEMLASLVMRNSSALELRDAQDGDEGIKGDMLGFLDAMRSCGYTFSVRNNDVYVKKFDER